MSRTQSPLTTRGLELIAQGYTLRAAALLVGVDKATLVRACQRAGIALKRGRRPAPTSAQQPMV